MPTWLAFVACGFQKKRWVGVNYIMPVMKSFAVHPMHWRFFNRNQLLPLSPRRRHRGLLPPIWYSKVPQMRLHHCRILFPSTTFFVHVKWCI